jgi:DNA-binding FrmR family transcriptional regulator
MKIEDPNTKEKLIQRLGRIEGQLRGIQTMLEEERDCREIMQQLSAASAALKSSSRNFFQDYAVLCLTELGDTEGIAPGDQDQLLAEMMSLLDKTP